MDKYTAYGTITKNLFGDSSEFLAWVVCDATTDVESDRHVLQIYTVL